MASNPNVPDSKRAGLEPVPTKLGRTTRPEMPHARPIRRRQDRDPVGHLDSIVDAGRESEPFLLFATREPRLGRTDLGGRARLELSADGNERQPRASQNKCIPALNSGAEFIVRDVFRIRPYGLGSRRSRLSPRSDRHRAQPDLPCHPVWESTRAGQAPAG
jgi:hypothetical protein